jgi:hypothetical protein
MQKLYRTPLCSFLSVKDRSAKIALTITIFLFAAANTSAQIQWSNTGTATNWNDAANWSPNTAFNDWLSTSVAQFNNNGTATTCGIDMSQGSLSIGAITGVTRLRDLTIGNSSFTPGTLTLHGATIAGTSNVIISIPGVSPPDQPKYYIQDNETGTGKTMTLALGNITNNIVKLASLSSLEISAAITGTGKKLTLAGANSFPSTLTLSGANTYTGLTTVQSKSAKIVLNRPGGGTLPATNDVYIGDGTMHVMSDQTLHNITIGGLPGCGMVIGNGATVTVTGTLKITGGIGISLQGTGKLVYAPGATLEYNSFEGSTSDREFPVVAGPDNLKVTGVTAINLHQTRAISGNLHLDDSRLYLNASDLTVSTVTYANNGMVVTNGTGSLIVTNMGLTAMTLPISPSYDPLVQIFNPIVISNGQGLNYAVRVENGINPGIAHTDKAINRTWFITPSATPASPVTVSFSYLNTDGNANFNYTAPVEVAQYGTSWNVIETNISQTQPLFVNINTLVGGQSNRFVITNVGAVLAYGKIDISAEKQNNNGHVVWHIESTADIVKLELERSANGRTFSNLTTVGTTSVYFDDDKLLSGTNYYRLKLTDINGKVSYSAIVALLNKTTGFEIVNLVPVLVNTNAILNVTTAQKTKMDIVITDATGRKVQKISYNLVAGSNQFNLNLTNLSAGTYQITGYTGDDKSRTIRFVKQ